MPSNNPPHSDRRPHDLRSTLTKSKILDGARQVFLLNGYAAASIDQIINQSGVSKGSIYHHFESKDVLFNSLVAAEAERIARVLPSIDQDDPDPCSALHQIGMAILDTLNNPATISTLRLIIGALGRFPRLGRGIPSEQSRPNRGADRSLSRRQLGCQRYSDHQQLCRGGGVREAMPGACDRACSGAAPAFHDGS